MISRVNDPTDSQDTYGLYFNVDGRLYTTSIGGGLGSTKASWAADQNFIVAGTYNSNGYNGDLFIDGIKETLTQDNLNSMAGGTNNLVIGKHRDLLDFFPGTIGEVRISNIVRSDEWITTTNLSLTDALITFSDPPEPPPQYPPDRKVHAFLNFPKSYNMNLTFGFAGKDYIRRENKGFSQPF